MESFIDKVKIYKINRITRLINLNRQTPVYDYYAIVLIDEKKNTGYLEKVKPWYQFIQRQYLDQENEYLMEKLFLTKEEAEELRLHLNRVFSNNLIKTITIKKDNSEKGITDNGLVLSSSQIWDYSNSDC